VAPRAGAYAGSRGAAGGPPTPADAWSEEEDEPFGVLADDAARGYDYDDDRLPDDEDGASRHTLVVVGLPLLALALVIALAWWIGSALLSVSADVDGQGSTPTASAPAEDTAADQAPAGEAIPVAGATVFDPFGDGEAENDQDTPLTIDDDPATAWSTLTYRGSPAFGNLKPGVGVVYDLGSEQQLAGVTITSTTSGATLEIRTGDSADAQLDSYATVGSGTVDGTTEFTFDEAATARYVLVWVTGLVEGGDGFSADLAEVSILSAG
jgi:hypothetical protein